MMDPMLNRRSVHAGESSNGNKGEIKNSEAICVQGCGNSRAQNRRQGDPVSRGHACTAQS
jgi:hypothetical protein